MDLIGHLSVIEDAGVCPAAQLWGERAVWAFLPNLAHCHEWAYAELWHAHRSRSQVERRLVQGHMICDWVIHYGTRRVPAPERIGWAYHQMPIAAAQLETFMQHIVARGLVAEDPRTLDTREHMERDFGHTAVECALDLWLARRRPVSRHVASIGDAFRRFDAPDALDGIMQNLHAIGGVTKEPPAVLARTLAEYARWSRIAVSLEQYAAFGLAARYGIEETPDALAFVSGFLDELARKLDDDATRSAYDAIVRHVQDPELCLA